MTRFEVRTGDCLAVMRTIEDSSVDSIVTDPPYELGFMGKSWDASGVAFRVEVWREALRVLKPGGHLLAFSGSRTYHRMAVAIEDAGFEIRDQIMWVYGSGFPKSLDVSKAIDKRGGANATFEEFRDAVKEAMRTNNVSRTKLNHALGNFMLSHYLTQGSQPAIPNIRDYRIIRDTVGLSSDWDHFFNEEADREVVGRKTVPTGHAFAGDIYGAESENLDVPITAPATPEAQRWQGWGTALKPAHEPIVVARKPLVGTVAANVLAHGTGALNIDGCRVGTEGGTRGSDYDKTGLFGIGEKATITPIDAGRWPANLIHDGSEEVVGMFPDTGPSKASARGGAHPNPNLTDWLRTRKDGDQIKGHDDAGGSAARFFYSAKASKRDRDEGLDGFQAVRTGAIIGAESAMLTGSGNERTTTRANIHPTVKPTDLMRYLCRLVTPPGGLVLDPFTGSGSTGKGAVLEGFRFIGIELSPEYTEIARARIRHAVGHVAPEPVTEAQVPDAQTGQLRLFA